ncbi:protein adenylyltransferase SelO [Vibrio methylphosphonaticus]|uniref:protein adenylyltransferase SelO n=1 Tax=Vibrio methylphosphonaticus TaxID=2946866 RepID=UPI00202A0217|nr:protein adenylyltransferase SelO family protein [Vibrio methylphosphonaticus]MCL9773741.1 protein adenylyltransferase SelO family protein [Vibrio methylphosphonaticus]
MSDAERNKINMGITTIEALAKAADYSLLNTLNRDPDATSTGEDYTLRPVFSGHYVPVKPTPIANPIYVSHSRSLFRELGLDDKLAQTDAFRHLFSGELSHVPSPMETFGWATGYALSIYGTEYIEQCPFKTGNGYGDGRAISVFEGILNNQRWEMQLKGGGTTPYCRGADGRAVLRSSVREFLAQEFMHALGVPSTRSLSLFVSQSESVDRPWYTDGSHSDNPDIMVSNPVAITTRVASSFLRVGQLELFARRARSQTSPDAIRELEMIVNHAIAREYSEQIDINATTSHKVLALAVAFRERLTSLITQWMRVGFCQGNFNSDNCAVGGFTLDFGPFGFCERFEPYFQPWTGGGRHFSFFNQPLAAEKNFESFCSALMPLIHSDSDSIEKLGQIQDDFSTIMHEKLSSMWASKLGLDNLDSDLLQDLFKLMMETHVDFTIFFRQLSHIPNDISTLAQSFYTSPEEDLLAQWRDWLSHWRRQIDSSACLDDLSKRMKQVNPKYTWREWLVVPAYKQAEQQEFGLIHELQAVLADPYGEQSQDVEHKYYQLRPLSLFDVGGVTHYSCSS